MTEAVIFYEKPGCVTNAKQKDLLRALGHRVEVRNLLTEPWTRERLRDFFGERPVSEWLNPTAPRVKSGEVRPSEIGETEALELMVADPILIRRPLMEVEGRRTCGFEPETVRDLLGVYLDLVQDMQACSRLGTGLECPPPGGA